MLLISGIFWTLMTAVMTIVLLFDESMDMMEKISSLLFMSIFWVVGIGQIVLGVKTIKALKKSVKEIANSKKYYGKIFDIYSENNSNVQADIAVYDSENNNVFKVTEPLYNSYNYRIGSFVQIQYIYDSYRVVGRANLGEIPSEVMTSLEGIKSKRESIIQNENAPETIIINGEEYVRK